MRTRWRGLLGSAVLLVCACQAPDPGQSPAAVRTPVETPAAGAPASPAPGSRAQLTDRNGVPVPVLPFDLARLPLSDATLPAIPFFALPAGYRAQNTPYARAYARFPFRLGQGVHWVEGPSWSARIVSDGDVVPGAHFSAQDLGRALDAAVTAAGGQKVFEGALKRDIYYGPQLEGEIGGGFIDAVNGDQQAPTHVYVVRQAGRAIWLQLATDSMGAGLVVMEQAPFTPTAAWTDAFPHLGLPAGYRDRNAPVLREAAGFPFWDGARLEPLEGRTWVADFDKGEHEYSVHEVRRNLQAMMDGVGATKVFEGRLPAAAADAVPKDVQADYGSAVGYDWSDQDVAVYRVDLADGRQVWVHARLYYLSAGWVVLERSSPSAGRAPAGH